MSLVSSDSYSRGPSLSHSHIITFYNDQQYFTDFIDSKKIMSSKGPRPKVLSKFLEKSFKLKRSKNNSVVKKSFRPLITNLTCPGDSSLYVEWGQPEEFYHGVDSYNVFIKTRDMDHWQRAEVTVPPVNKHHVEKVNWKLLGNIIESIHGILFLLRS